MSVTAADTAAGVWPGTLATRVRQVGLLSISMNVPMYMHTYIYIYLCILPERQ